MKRHFMPILLALLWAFWPMQAYAAATLLPNGEQCFAAVSPTSGGASGTGTGFIGLLGTITGGSGGTTGTYGGVPLTGGHGTNATANITVSGGAVTAVAIVNPGVQFIVGDVLSASSANIGNVSGFSVPISSVSINQSLAGGTVAFYVPNTNTYKQTWFNADQAATHQNTNPVTLDANGCAIIYGIGSYRQILQDSLGNIVWDQITTDTSANNNTFWAGLASGTPNVITVTDPGFNGTDGSVIQFIPLYINTGATTLNPSGYGAYPIVKDTATGAVALTGGEFVANSPSNVVSVVFSASQQNFHILNLLSATSTAPTSTVPTPQGYLNLVGINNGGPYQNADVVGATTVYYTPATGNQVPVWNGSSFSVLTTAELPLTLNSSKQSSNNIYDVCVFNSGGTPIAVFGPAWSNSSAGTSARGTGGGTTQLIQQSGLWVNAVNIAANNGANNYTVPALQCTYVGSVLIDSNPGQVSNYISWGNTPTRKWGVWNAYNQQIIIMLEGDSNASWTYNTATVRQSDAAGTNGTNNLISTFTGLQQSWITCTFTQHLNNSASANVDQMRMGIGFNSTTAFSGTYASFSNSAPGSTSLTATFSNPPSLGLNTVYPLEQGSGVTTGTYSGTQPLMVLQCSYRG